MVADHLGHSLNIHTTVYKLQQNVIERSKVARILTLLESGSVEDIKRSTPTKLNSIPLSDIPSKFNHSLSLNRFVMRLIRGKM